VTVKRHTPDASVATVYWSVEHTDELVV